MRRVVLFVLLALSTRAGCQPVFKTENVFLVTLDGMRWQEVFGGADSSWMKQQINLKDHKVKDKYWRSEEGERRKALMPFLWTTVAAKGQLYGNRRLGSQVNVTNQMWFSYPGYHELLSGFADDVRIRSNDKVYNENKTVLEFINQQSGFKGKVAAYTSWDVFPYIINDKRSGVYVNAGEVRASEGPVTERERLLNQIMPVVPNMLEEVRLDAFTFYYGLEYLKKQKPRVMYFSFDETDDFAHMGEYAAYLKAAHAADGFIRELWEFLQTDAAYKNKTTLIVTVDHGRGNTETSWRSHGRQVEGADQIWFGIIGPDTPASGEQQSGRYYQNQLAATMAALLGLRYENDRVIGKPIDNAIKK